MWRTKKEIWSISMGRREYMYRPFAHIAYYRNVSSMSEKMSPTLHCGRLYGILNTLYSLSSLIVSHFPILASSLIVESFTYIVPPSFQLSWIVFFFGASQLFWVISFFWQKKQNMQSLLLYLSFTLLSFYLSYLSTQIFNFHMQKFGST